MTPGLKRLAAILLLCAETDRYEPGFHMHLDHDGESLLLPDMPVTVYGPHYLSAFLKGRLEWHRRDISPAGNECT